MNRFDLLILIFVIMFSLDGLARVFYYNKWRMRDTDGIYNKIKIFNHKSYRSIVIFMGLFLFLYFIDFIKNIKNIEDILIVTLTLILVYATLSLLSFTHTLVMKNERSEEVVVHEIKENEDLKYRIKKSIKENSDKLRRNLEKTNENPKKIKEMVIERENSLEKKFYEQFIERSYKDKIDYEIKIRKSGEAFFRATILSALGFFIIFLSILFSKIPLDSSSVILSFIKNISSNEIIIVFYFNFAFILIIYGVLNFLKGLFIVLSSLMKKNDDEFI